MTATARTQRPENNLQERVLSLCRYVGPRVSFSFTGLAVRLFPMSHLAHPRMRILKLFRFQAGELAQRVKALCCTSLIT